MAEDNNAGGSNTTICFPESLRANAEDGYAHIQFTINTPSVTEAKSIHLFVPQGFSVPDAAGYGNVDLGVIGTADNLAAGGTVTESDALAGSVTAVGTFGGGVGQGVKTNTLMKQGLAVNPYTATTFTNTTIRSFGFTFKLVSESKEESLTASVIENIFRKYLYPKSAGAGTLEYPPTFDISFYNGEAINKFMPKILPAYLVNLTTTYNSTTNAFHDDGQPVEIDIAMTFQETRPLTRGDLYDINNTLDNDIGYTVGDSGKVGQTIRGKG